MNETRNILVIRLKSIGDILLTLPAVQRLRDNFPHARLSFLTSKEHAPLLRGFAEVNDVIVLDRALYRQKSLPAICSHTFELIRRLRAGRFSLVVDFQGYGETALLTWTTRAPQRWGSIYRQSRAWAYTHGVRRNDAIHPADWNLSLLEQCGLPAGHIRNEFNLPQDPVESALQFFTANGLSHASPTLFLQPFTSSPQKNWPLGKFLAVATHWRSRGVQVIFGGGPADRPALETARLAGFPISAGMPVLTTAGLMQMSSLIVGADTGLLHLAVAMGKRVVMLIASTVPGRTFPYQHADWAVTPDSGKPVSSTSIEAVIQATAEALAEAGFAPSLVAT